MIKEHELTKEIIESGIRSIRSKGTETGIIIEFNDKTELSVDAVAHTLSTPRDLREMWKEEVYPHLMKFLDFWEAFRITKIPYPQMSLRYDKEDDTFNYYIDREDKSTTLVKVAVLKHAFKSLSIESTQPIECLLPFRLLGDDINGFHRFLINPSYLKMIAVVSNNILIRKLWQKYIEA
jgi:hypothetical protein|nr:MAG TPA: Usg-like family protein [Caudoviricetes sp.]